MELVRRLNVRPIRAPRMPMAHHAAGAPVDAARKTGAMLTTFRPAPRLRRRLHQQRRCHGAVRAAASGSTPRPLSAIRALQRKRRRVQLCDPPPVLYTSALSVENALASSNVAHADASGAYGPLFFDNDDGDADLAAEAAYVASLVLPDERPAAQVPAAVAAAPDAST